MSKSIQDQTQIIKDAVLSALSQKIREGSTFAIEKELLETVAQYLDITRADVSDVLYELTIDGDITRENLAGVDIIMPFKYRKAELGVAAKLYILSSIPLTAVAANLKKEIKKSETELGIKLSDNQKDAVTASFKNGVSVITGGPGTGKTTIIHTILSILKREGLKTYLAAPTGRAAKRMSQASGEKASTIHRLLEYYYLEEEDRMIFGKNAENPLDADCIIVDESSMIDILLMDALLDAIKPGTRLILVGDINQLPPVGAGNVLSDIIACDFIHVTNLTDIFRQAQESMIIVNAHLINKGEKPSYNDKDTDFFFLDRSSDKEIAFTIKDLCQNRLPAFYKDLDIYKDIQVLSPVKKGITGTENLNQVLREVLNPKTVTSQDASGKQISISKAEVVIFDRLFREGDKVMHNKNNYMLEWKNIQSMETGHGVFNGDMGVITSVDQENGKVGVLFDDDRLVTYEGEALAELEPAFAITVHKSQGSEFPVVVMPVTRIPELLATRNLLYTAVTRAKNGVILVGNQNAASAMIDNNLCIERASGLLERLKLLFTD